jgi:hypothetical protein
LRSANARLHRYAAARVRIVSVATAAAAASMMPSCRDSQCRDATNGANCSQRSQRLPDRETTAATADRRILVRSHRSRTIRRRAIKSISQALIRHCAARQTSHRRDSRSRLGHFRARCRTRHHGRYRCRSRRQSTTSRHATTRHSTNGQTTARHASATVTDRSRRESRHSAATSFNRFFYNRPATTRPTNT